MLCRRCGLRQRWAARSATWVPTIAAIHQNLSYALLLDSIARFGTIPKHGLPASRRPRAENEGSPKVAQTSRVGKRRRGRRVAPCSALRPGTRRRMPPAVLSREASFAMTIPSAAIIIPAWNEERTIARCLRAVAQQSFTGNLHVVLVSNGSADRTVEVAEGQRSQFEARGWMVTILGIPEASKTAALNVGDPLADGDVRIYLDADAALSPNAVAALAEAVGSVPRLAARSWSSLRGTDCSPERTRGRGAGCRRSRTASSAAAALR